MPDNTLSTLQRIRIKIRRLTRTPSILQITDGQIDEYVNTFVLYDFPEMTLDKKLTFYLSPNVDTYSTNTALETSPLYNFKNKYISVHSPVYINGFAASLIYSQEEFYREYPKNNQSEVIGTGDGATVGYDGTAAHPILPRTFSISSLGIDGIPQVARDIPIVDGPTGTEMNSGRLYTPGITDPAFSIGTIDYITGVYHVDFPTAPAAGEDVVVSGNYYSAGRPTLVLYDDLQFQVRPVPDKNYQIDINVFQRPDELLASGSMPELSQWWQYIAYGGAKKIFEDRMDSDSVSAIMPEFTRQRALVFRKMSLDMGNQRTATIYSSGVSGYGVRGFGGSDGL